MGKTSSPEDQEPIVWGLVCVGTAVVSVGNLVPLILVEWILHHDVWIRLEHVSVKINSSLMVTHSVIRLKIEE